VQKFHNLTFFTGKGGVGKSTLALSYLKFLKSKGLKTYLVPNINDSIGSIHPSKDKHENKEDYFFINHSENFKNYIAKKLGSKLVANSLVKIPLFQNLVSVMPGLNYISGIGGLIESIEEDPELHYVIDAPASGHVLSLIGSLYRFRSMFKVGPLYQDCDRIINFLENTSLTKLNLIALPNPFSASETLETHEELLKISSAFEIEIFINQYLEIKSNLPFFEKMLQKQDLALVALHAFQLNSVPFAIGNKKQIENTVIANFDQEQPHD
jgi:anion-transporting  ArsA/GET3 family ATPase